MVGAAERLPDLPGRLFHPRVVGHIDGVRERADAATFRHFAGRIRDDGVSVEQGDVRPLGGERRGHGPADPPRRPDDHGRLPLQFQVHGYLLVAGANAPIL